MLQRIASHMPKTQYRVKVYPWCNMYEPQIKRFWFPFWCRLGTEIVDTNGGTVPVSFSSSSAAWDAIMAHQLTSQTFICKYEYHPPRKI